MMIKASDLSEAFSYAAVNDIIYEMEESKEYRHKSLRSEAINYRSGWWSVSIQIAKNKSILGAIVGEEVSLNELGREVESYWKNLPSKYPELELFDFVVMPNHFHALLRIHYAPTNREHHLGFLLSRFKGGTAFIYGKMKREGLVPDIGEHLWQHDYWDDLVTGEEEFKAWTKYIRDNPKNWSRDRYGACTTYSLGNIDLLDRPRIAFVASQGYFASELKPRRIRAAKAARYDKAGQAPGEAARYDKANKSIEGSARSENNLSKGSALAERVLISTFTSAQEREALRRAIAKGTPIIMVAPSGIPNAADISPELAKALEEGRALIISPQPEGSRLNKKVATWCNEYVLRQADEIWTGDISPNGMLSSLLKGIVSTSRIVKNSEI